VTSDLQMGVMQTRMQPIRKVFSRFPRLARDLARSLDKEIELTLHGEETALDKNLVEALADPLVHLVRNAMDHGIESPKVRAAAGKPRTGKVELSASARAMLLKNGVDTVFLTKNGGYLGRFASPEPRNVMLRKRQFCLLDDQDFALHFCRSVVRAKLASMMTLLMRIKRTRNIHQAKEKASQVRALLPKLEECTDIDGLRGYEGRGAAIYFSGFRFGFLHDHGFRRRVRRPPTDPVNAVLSLLYTFLFNRVYAAVRRAHLDPYPGFLHVPDYGRHSLVLDLMEEFRVIIADTLTLSLFNLRILDRDDFETKRLERIEPQDDEEAGNTADFENDPCGFSAGVASPVFDLPPQRMDDTLEHALEEHGHDRPAVLLKPEAFKRVIENFERKMATTFHHPVLDEKISYNEALFVQANLFRKLVEGESRSYQPLVLQ